MLLVACCSLFVVRCLVSGVSRVFLLLVICWSLVAVRCWLLVAGCCVLVFVVRCVLFADCGP